MGISAGDNVTALSAHMALGGEMCLQGIPRQNDVKNQVHKMSG